MIFIEGMNGLRNKSTSRRGGGWLVTVTEKYERVGYRTRRVPVQILRVLVGWLERMEGVGWLVGFSTRRLQRGLVS